MGGKKSTDRQRLIKLIHVARRELGMDDDSYRMMLAGMPALGGKTSSADLSINGLNLVVNALKAKGFKIRPKPKSTQKPRRQNDLPLADDAQSKKIRSLWLELHDVGEVRDPSEYALSRFVCRMVKIEALQWLNTAQASKVIEHLKKWQKRVIDASAEKK